MDERLKFVARILQGEKMAPLWREFGISRVTGYKIYERYRQYGLDAAGDSVQDSVLQRWELHAYRVGQQLSEANVLRSEFTLDYRHAKE